MKKIHRKTGRICKLAYVTMQFSRLHQGGRSIRVAIKCPFLAETLKNKVQMGEVLALDISTCNVSTKRSWKVSLSFELEVLSWNNRFRLCYQRIRKKDRSLSDEKTCR